jgi:hypothetical protein
MICIIGSHALNAHKLTRRPVDLDLVCSYEELMAYANDVHYGKIVESYPSTKGTKWIIKGKHKTDVLSSNIIEAEIAWDGSLSKELHDLIVNDKDSIRVNDFYLASLDVCYMLKMSHRYLRNSPHFLKTMRDIQAMRKLGAKIRKEHREFYKKRMAATYYYKHPSLMQDKENFFKDDGITYVYDHDSIHESIKLGDAPAYTYFKSDNAEVQCDMKKFFAIDEQIRMNAVCEESMVLAIERAVVPFNVEPILAYKKALMKVCTSITSGKFREYAWENYDKAIAMFDEQKFIKFWDDVNTGKVDKATKPMYSTT